MKWEIFIALFAVTSSITQKAPGTSKTGIQEPLSPKEIEGFSKFLEKTSVIGKAEEGVTVPADDYAWVNSGKFEGDVILDDIQRQKIVAIVGSTGRAVVTNLTHLWPSKNIPYVIRRGDFDASQVAAIEEVLDRISTESCLIFQNVSGTKTRDVIIIGGQHRGCFSAVGKRGGRQPLNLDRTHPVGSGCFRQGAVAHEMFHSLGFFHTQSRMDRDEYVRIIWENVREGRQNNFRKYGTGVLGGKDLLNYDYYSIMHYPRHAFSGNGQDTIVPLRSDTFFIGQRMDIFHTDLVKLNLLYCNDTMTPRPESSWKRPKYDSRYD